jgi:hypothetical protein
MNNDFYAPGALDVLQKFARELSRSGPRMDQETKETAEATFRRMADVIGILS